MINILVLSAGRRVELVEAFMTEIGNRNLESSVFAVDAQPKYSAACQIVADFKQAPHVTDLGYIDFLLQTCIDWEIGIVIPTIDTELLVLARHRDQFTAKGVNILISDEELIRVCRDKRLSADLFDQLDIKTPKIYSKENLQYPCFAKPYDGSSSIGAMKINSVNDLSDFILGNEKMMFMEFIGRDFSEYTIDAYYDRNGRLCCLVPRQRLEVRAGEISKGITRRNEIYEYLFPRLNKLRGARGCITIQIFAKTSSEEYAAIEINPRFGGGFPLSYSSGANFPGWILDEYLLNKNVPFYDQWNANLLMLRYDAKILVNETD